MVSEPSSTALLGKGAGCLSGVGTFLPGTVLQAVQRVSEHSSRALWGKGAGCLSGVDHCGAGMQTVKSGREPTSWALLGRGSGCLVVSVPWRNWIMFFFFYLRSDQVKPGHMYFFA